MYVVKTVELNINFLQKDYSQSSNNLTTLHRWSVKGNLRSITLVVQDKYELPPDELGSWPFSNESLGLLARSRNEESPQPLPFLEDDLAECISYSDYSQTFCERSKLFHEKPGFRTKLVFKIRTPAFVYIGCPIFSQQEILGIKISDIVRVRAIWKGCGNPDNMLRGLSEAWRGDVELDGSSAAATVKRLE